MHAVHRNAGDPGRACGAAGARPVEPDHRDTKPEFRLRERAPREPGIDACASNTADQTFHAHAKQIDVD